MNPKQRYFARRMIMQALYEKEIAENDNQSIIAGFILDKANENIKFDQSYFQTNFISITEHLLEIDTLYSQYISRDISELDPVSKSILRLGTHELKNNLDIPYKVVINESVNLAKSFGAEDSYKFINGTLDQVAKEVRAQEI